MDDNCHSDADDARSVDERQVEGEGSEVEDDIYSQLAQKEQDLLLAAELGKALLEKNEELEQRNAALVEEYTQKTEELEQERYSLQMQLAQRQVEFESTIKDLQEDVMALQDQLSNHDNEVSAGNRKHTQDLRQLQQHNEILSEQLRQSAAQQEALTAELDQLRGQLSSRRTSIDQRANQMGELEDELASLRHRQQELEVRIRTVTEERDALASELEDLQEYVLKLEKQRQRQDSQLTEQQREMQELQDSNTSLQVQLDHINNYVHNSSGSSQTLFSELASMSDMPDSLSQVHNLDRVTSLSAEMLDEEDFECDDDPFITDTAMASSPFMTDDSACLHNSSACHDDAPDTDHQLVPETVLDMMSEAGAEWGEAEGPSGKSHMHDNHNEKSAGGKTGEEDKLVEGRKHLALTEELQMLLMEMSTQAEHREEKQDLGNSFVNDSDDEISSVDDFPQHYPMGAAFHRQFSLPSIQPEISDILQDHQRRSAELQKERDALQDQACGGVSPDDILRQTRAERDAAQRRVEQLEHDLAQSRQDVASLSGQLMAAIHQKVTISQELDQWQVDLSDMLMAQVQTRITEQQRAEQAIGQLEKQVKGSHPSARSTPFKLHKS